jgi:hypothetical protein
MGSTFNFCKRYKRKGPSHEKRIKRQKSVKDVLYVDHFNNIKCNFNTCIQTSSNSNESLDRNNTLHIREVPVGAYLYILVKHLLILVILYILS